MNNNQSYLQNLIHKDKPSKAIFDRTVSWLRSIVIILENEEWNLPQNIQRVNENRFNGKLQEKCFGSLYQSLNFLSSLYLNKDSQNSEHCQSGIINWYYSIYNASIALLLMIQLQEWNESHRETAKVFYEHLVNNNKDYLGFPFNFGASSLLFKSDRNSEVEKYSDIEQYAKNNGYEYRDYAYPYDFKEAKAIFPVYFKGSMDWWIEENVDPKIKEKKHNLHNFQDSDFGKDGKEKFIQTNNISDPEKYKVDNFRKRINQQIRDKEYKKFGGISFLHVIQRLRGKSNYRDSLFLTFGLNNKDDQFNKRLNQDLYEVAKAFFCRSALIIESRISKTLWHEFSQDVKANSALQILRSNHEMADFFVKVKQI